MVTIQCATYNHFPFIRQCLDGFVNQITDFRYEAIVHDDLSTDGTAEIVREYAEKYPDIIKPVFEKENQYSKGNLEKIMNSYNHGKYIAICEGDDYWTDPYKLQKQVDYLEHHPDYVLTYTNVSYIDKQSKKINYGVKYKHYEGNCLKPLVMYTNFIVTNTVCFRKDALDGWDDLVKSMPFNLLIGDKPKWLYLAGKGKFKYFDRRCSAYRILEESASHTNDINKAIMLNENGKSIALFFNNYYSVGVKEDFIERMYARGKMKIYKRLKPESFFSFTLETIKMHPFILLSMKFWFVVLLYARGYVAKNT